MGSRPRPRPHARPAAGAAAGLVALLLAAGLLPLADAAPPPQQPWQATLGSVGAGAAQALGFDEAGTRILVGTADRASTGTDSDLALVRFDEGNVTAAPDQDGPAGVGVGAPNQGHSGEGKPAAAISGDGRYAVAGGNYSGDTSLVGPNVFYYALPDMSSVWTAAKPEPVTTVAISHDGQVVAVGTRNLSENQPGRIYRFAGGGTQVWQANANQCGNTQGQGGQVFALDVSRDGKWIVAGVGLVANGEPIGCVLLFDSASLTPVASFAVPALAGSDVTAVDVSATGSWYAAGTRGGRFLVFANTAQGRANPLQEQLNALAPVQAVRVTEDGSAAVVADAGSVNRYTQAGGVLLLDWSAPVTRLRSLDMTGDGEYVVVGAAGLSAFHRSSNLSLWTVDLADALVRVARPSPADVRIAAATGDHVRGYRLHWDFAVSKPEPEPLAIGPGQARTYTLAFTNTGSGVDTFDLDASAPGFQAALEPPQLQLRPGETGNVTVTLAPQPGTTAGLYRVQVHARGVRSGVDSTAVFNASLEAVERIILGLSDASFRDRAVSQGDDLDVVLQVQNTGNSRVEVLYDVAQNPNQGGPWDAALSRTSGSVDPGGVSTNTLRVVVPFDAANGTENVLTVTARGDGTTSNLTLRFVVNPFFTAALDVIPRSKQVEPGKSVSYDVVVANNGTLRETYRLVYCASLPGNIPCLGNATLGLGGWSVALDTSPFTLDKGQSRSFPMTVGAPRGALPDDRLVLQVEAISATPQAAQHTFRDSQLVVTTVVESLAEPQEPFFTPGFEALGALAALGAAMVAARRRP